MDQVSAIPSDQSDTESPHMSQYTLRMRSRSPTKSPDPLRCGYSMSSRWHYWRCREQRCGERCGERCRERCRDTESDGAEDDDEQLVEGDDDQLVEGDDDPLVEGDKDRLRTLSGPRKNFCQFMKKARISEAKYLSTLPWFDEHLQSQVFLIVMRGLVDHFNAFSVRRLARTSGSIYGISSFYKNYIDNLLR